MRGLDTKSELEIRLPGRSRLDQRRRTELALTLSDPYRGHRALALAPVHRLAPCPTRPQKIVAFFVARRAASSRRRSRSTSAGSSSTGARACCSSSASSSFALIIAGLVLNTIFLVREVRRNEQHDTFINAVTHELKTPIASIRLYLETLQSRDRRRREAAGVLPDDARRQRSAASHCRAGAARRPRRASSRRRRTACRSTCARWRASASTLARVRHHLPAEALAYCETCTTARRRRCSATPTSCKAAVLEPARQRGQVLARGVRVDGRARARRSPTRRGPACRDRGDRHPADAAEAHLPPLLPHSRTRGDARQRHRPRPLHRPVRRPRSTAAACSPRARAGPRQHVHRSQLAAVRRSALA